jgi:hypothetical protein
VPGRIVVAVVAELTVYGIVGREGRFAELLRILETKCESRWLPKLRGEFGDEVRCRPDGSRRSSVRWRGSSRICATNLAARCAGPNGGRSCCRISAMNLATKSMEWMGWQTVYLWVAWLGAR